MSSRIGVAVSILRSPDMFVEFEHGEIGREIVRERISLPSMIYVERVMMREARHTIDTLP